MSTKINTVGVDLAKNIFQIHAVNERGKKVLNKAITPSKFKEWLVNLPSCRIGIEACGGSHYWARKIGELGHEPCIVAPQFVKPFVKSNKNDAKDAEAIVEAILRPSMRYVSVKKHWQQDVLALHKVRQRLVKNRTAVINETRGLLYEYGLTLPQGATTFRKLLLEKIEESEDLTESIKDLAYDLHKEVSELDEKISKIEKKIHIFFTHNEDCKRVNQIPGLGVLTSTALVTHMGSSFVFKNGREFSASLGLVSRQSSSGGKERLLGISKRGNIYLRTLLIQGARTVVMKCKNKKDKRSLWLQKLLEEKGYNKVAVALANRNARTAWALIHKKEDYKNMLES